MLWEELDHPNLPGPANITSKSYPTGGKIVEQVFALKHMVAAVVYSLIGIVILIVSVLIFDKLTPGPLWEDIVKDKNLPLAITLGATIIAIGMIIASAIHG